MLVVLVLCGFGPLRAQAPFYTDDTAVTERGKFHFEFFNEYDVLQEQDPNLRQNTANFKLNYGLAHRLEVDLDVPYLRIERAVGNAGSVGGGDTNLGLKANLREESAGSRAPALAATFYIEFPTGDTQQQLGSGLHDYALNFVAQKSIAKTTRVTANAGFLFAGNTSTGAIGIQGTRGHVFTGGLSVLHDLQPRLTLGAEVIGGRDDNGGLGKGQLQGMVGGQYLAGKGVTLCFGLLGGKYVASPRVGGQFGIAVDLPGTFRGRRHF